MATVGLPSPGLFASVLHVLRAVDPRERTVASAFAELIESATETEAAQLPAAIAGVIPLLRGDMERMRFAAEALVRFDMYESCESVADAAIETADRDLLMSAASLCGNPGVAHSLRERVVRALDGSRNGLIRLDETIQPTTADELRLHHQRWPGSRPDEEPFRLAPVVVLDQGFASKDVLRLSIRVDGAGGTIRRLPPGLDAPNWFGPQTVACCLAPTRSRILSGKPLFPERQIIVDPPLATERDLGLAVQRLSAALPTTSRLRLQTFEPEVATTVWDPEVYSLGVYETREAAFLTTAPTSSLYRLAKKGILTPRHAGVAIWAFSDLVAVRTWRYLSSRSSKRVPSDVVPALARFAGDADAVKVGATSDGKVLVDRGDGWVDVRTGQKLLDLPIADLDDAFRPFSLGGRWAPDLLEASANTRLHPAVLHGVPYLKDHRITARALALLDDRGGDVAIHGAYPELEGKSISDTVAVGHQLVGTR